jgi:serine/threonine protein kinase
LGDFFLKDIEPRVEYSESEINDISQLLLHLNPSWSRIPRVYIVLRIIGCLHDMSTFVDVGFCDYDFPVTARSLPSELNPKARSDFVKNQTMVMTKSLNLEKREGGQHCFFKKNEYLPLRGEGILGVGGFGQVDKVLSLISFKEYARKRVLRTAAFGGRNAAAQRAFIKEIEILKRLKHWHIVEFVGSYTDHKYIAVLMEPIADMDLATYLEHANAEKHRELRTFFGCLSRALEFLHQQSIRHKDIKPQNILYEAGRGVLFTDFGLAFDFTEVSRSTTVGMVNGMTPMYCAPEVAAEEPRSTSSDVYSLGIVFLEMIVVLKGHSIEYLRTYFEAHGSKNWLIRKNNEALDSLIAELRNTAAVPDNKVLVWIERMLQQDQKLRPTAASLSEWCTLADENGIRQFSGICCLSPDESYSEASDDYWDDGSGSL